MVGTQIGNYRIVRSIGAGGMGVVYEALDPRIARRAAIKVLRADLAADPEVAARFINEARAVNIVRHSGIVDIFEVAQLPSGAAYIVMEFLDGESLARRMEAFPRMELAAAVRIARQIASAMAAAHARNIVHRDLKPDNVMLVADPETHAGERTKLLDFGIAKLEHALALDVRTRTGLLMGTPTYMAPEQYRGSGLVDDRADVYSLGVVLFEMLSGTLPFCSGTPAEMMAAHLFDEPPDLQRARPDAPAQLVALVGSMLAKAPGQRPSMVQIGAQLELLGAPRQTGPMAAEPPATISSTPPIPSTLGGAVGERVVEPAPATRRAGAAALVIALTLTAGLLMTRFRGTVQPPPPAPPPPPPVAMVHWSITSTPAGAVVRRADDGWELGRTPLERTVPQGRGAQWVTIALPGYYPRSVALSLAADSTVDEKLGPVEPPHPPKRSEHKKTDVEERHDEVELVH